MTAKAFEDCTDELANPGVIQVCIGFPVHTSFLCVEFGNNSRSGIESS